MEVGEQQGDQHRPCHSRERRCLFNSSSSSSSTTPGVDCGNIQVHKSWTRDHNVYQDPKKHTVALHQQQVIAWLSLLHETF